VGTAEQLYVRESRHILGEYQLTLDDVLENRWFDDTIAIGSYPVDVPPNAERTVGYIIGNPDRYGVPFRCLVPQEVDGLLVVGRSASYTSLAAGSARVIPLGMAEGDAAGVAAAYAEDHGMTFRQISQDADAVAAIQQTLREQGAYLEQWPPVQETVEQHWAYEGVKTLRSLGVLYGGYQNDYRLEEAITREDFLPMLRTLGDEIVLSLDYTGKADQPLTCEEILYMVENTLQLQSPEAMTHAGVLVSELKPYFADGQKTPQRAEVIMLMANAWAYQQRVAGEA